MIKLYNLLSCNISFKEKHRFINSMAIMKYLIKMDKELFLLNKTISAQKHIIKMKNKIFFLLAMLSCLIVGCKDEDIRYSIERPDDTMHLQVSDVYVELNQKSGKEEAVSFSWNEVTNAP